MNWPLFSLNYSPISSISGLVRLPPRYPCLELTVVGYVVALQPHFPLIVTIVGYSGFIGMSLSVSLLSDLLSLLTLHISSFYVASARIYDWQLTILISLFHLFRGKKRNVLRDRIDSCDYDLDQLLLGTILFTLLAFLFPTVMVFYLTFVTARAGVLVGKVVLDVGLACLNHWPLFAIMLRVKDPARIPGIPPQTSYTADLLGGIRFELIQPPFTTTNTTYINIHSVPLPFKLIFSSYERVFTRLRQHYLVSTVLMGLLTGRPIREMPSVKLYSIQFGMLPKRRKTVRETWAVLTGKS
jgi:phosphatidylinositol N-acetylglucosaminyltransferase subunit Q